MPRSLENFYYFSGDITQLIENMGGKTSEKVDSKGKSVALVYEDEDENGKEQTIITWPFQGKGLSKSTMQGLLICSCVSVIEDPWLNEKF